MAFTLSHLERDLVDQARLDGALLRIVTRRVAPAMIAGLACATLLAGQEFAVFEMTGISVLATELRMVFETGRFSDANNPITLLQGGVSSGAGMAHDQSVRIARAIGAATPALICTVGLLWIARRLLQKQRDAFVESSPPARLVWRGQTTLALVIVTISLAMPVCGLVASLPRGWHGVQIVNDLAPQLRTSFALAFAVGCICFALAFAATVVAQRWVLTLAIISFLVGGQFIAIALLRLFDYDPAWMGDFSPLRLVLDTDAAVVMAHVARFAWIPLVAGMSTHGGAYRNLREQAAVEGATAWQTAIYIITPRAGPLLLAAAVCCGTLSITETPAATLLTPDSIVPMMMTWVHRQQYGPMIELSLVVVVLVAIASIAIQGLVKSLKLEA